MCCNVSMVVQWAAVQGDYNLYSNNLEVHIMRGTRSFKFHNLGKSEPEPARSQCV